MNTAHQLRVVSISHVKPDHSIRRKTALETMKRQNALHKRRLVMTLSASALLVLFNVVAVITLA